MLCWRSEHNLLMLGSPGAGKSRLARRLTPILPAMTLPEALDTTRMHRVAGCTGDRPAWVPTHSCCAPHQRIMIAHLYDSGSLWRVLPSRCTPMIMRERSPHRGTSTRILTWSGPAMISSCSFYEGHLSHSIS
jgi:Magnesium chelatase, subunit ChlI